MRSLSPSLYLVVAVAATLLSSTASAQEQDPKKELRDWFTGQLEIVSHLAADEKWPYMVVYSDDTPTFTVGTRFRNLVLTTDGGETVIEPTFSANLKDTPRAVRHYLGHAFFRMHERKVPPLVEEMFAMTAEFGGVLKDNLKLLEEDGPMSYDELEKWCTAHLSGARRTKAHEEQKQLAAQTLLLVYYSLKDRGVLTDALKGKLSGDALKEHADPIKRWKDYKDKIPALEDIEA